jgi:hypothetical protein
VEKERSMTVHAISVGFLMILLLVASSAAAADQGLLAAIRSGDSAAVKRVLQSAPQSFEWPSGLAEA